MARISKSQWEFDALVSDSRPPARPARTIASVAELTSRIKRSLEKDFANLWVSGEISNFRLQSSGHIYFVLKDASAQLQCVLFRGQSQVRRDWLRDGAHVLLGGEITVYEPRGQYQLRVSNVELQGAGALQAAFEQLKQKLQAEGLFDPQRKRPIPRFPKRVGVVTSPTGAAFQDVLHVLGRRHAGLEIILAPVRVQGEGAAAEIARAITQLNTWSAQQHPDASPQPALDVLLVTRGGGSLEDLWAFNEEIVARAIAASHIPVISAVGHEIDFTISDFVADLRAATPSAAAELLTEGFMESRTVVVNLCRRLARATASHLDNAASLLAHLHQRHARLHPRRRLELHLQRLDDILQTLSSAAKRSLRSSAVNLHHSTRQLLLHRPSRTLAHTKNQLQQTALRATKTARQRILALKSQLDSLATRLHLLSPQNTLERGYSITVDSATGRILRNSQTLSIGQRISTQLLHGSIESAVQSLSPAPPPTPPAPHSPTPPPAP